MSRFSYGSRELRSRGPQLNVDALAGCQLLCVRDRNGSISRMGIEEDSDAARGRGLTFRVCRKDAPRAQWKRLEGGISELGTALRTAREVAAYESAVFTDTPRPLGGFLYWTSRRPDVSNAAVITQRVLEGIDGTTGAAGLWREFLTEVKATLFIAGRGLLVVPPPPPGPLPEGATFRVELRLPDGTRRQTGARLQTELDVPGPPRLTCVLPTTGKDEVPVGTELWLLRPEAAGAV